MPNSAQLHRTNGVIWCLGFLLMSLCEAIGQEITVSQVTTVITSPLAADGLPDFEAYLLKEGPKAIGR